MGDEIVNDEPETTEPEKVELPGAPRWLDLAIASSGVKEVEGAHDSPEVMAYYADAGYPEIQHDETPWCAAFACAMIERAGFASPKTLSARQFLRWGKPLKKGRPGAICVFSRGNPRGWQGHVGFYLDEDVTRIRVLGGNQSDAVRAAWYPKPRLLGYRWPVTARNSRTTKGVAVGTVGALAGGAAAIAQTVAETSPQVTAIGAEMKTTGIPWLQIVGSLLVIGALIAVAYAHRDDLKKNGK
jgi:uncharacterized protein (TIGR02594 family)